MEDDDVTEVPQNNAGRTTAIVAVVCLALGGAGGFFGATALGGGDGGGGATASSETGSPVTVDLGEFTTNLRDTSGGRIVKVRVAVDTTAAGAAVLATKDSEIRDSILMLLSDYTVPQLNGADARMVFREDVEIRLNTIVGPDNVIRIYLPDFIVQ
ncbi:MAG: flagellar basal body-associated FliL family protein [Myxococcota bacterium]|nr:flagellar basal body-associated FliL family protein [Myxococcota bacterium]